MDYRLNKKLVSLGSGLYEEVRLFSDEAIQKAVDQALETVAADKKGVLLKVDVDGQGMRAVLAAKPREHWTIGIIGEIDKEGEWKAGAHVAFDW